MRLGSLGEVIHAPEDPTGQIFLCIDASRAEYMCCGCGHGSGIWDGLYFSCEIVDCEKALISIFQQFFASVGKMFILGGRLRAGL